MTTPDPVYKCPVCGSTNVRRGKTSLPGDGDRTPNLIEFFCPASSTFESKRDDDPGFNAWYARWLVR